MHGFLKACSWYNIFPRLLKKGNYLISSFLSIVFAILVKWLVSVYPQDPRRLHYEPWELMVFEKIECQWPLFFAYLVLDGLFSNNQEQVGLQYIHNPPSFFMRVNKFQFFFIFIHSPTRLGQTHSISPAKFLFCFYKIYAFAEQIRRFNTNSSSNFSPLFSTTKKKIEFMRNKTNLESLDRNLTFALL